MRPRPSLLALALLPALVGCDTNADDVCEDIGDCAQGGSFDWIQSCEAQAAELATEAAASGCTSQYDAYYACADASYDCNGDTPTFDGCSGALAALQGCLVKGAASNACGKLSSALAACGADAGPSPPPSSPCGAGGVCEAQCYLDSVPDVCAPQPAQLTAFSQCASQCTF